MLNDPLPEDHRRAVRTLLRFAAAMTIVALLSGVLFQESAKKLALGDVEPGLHVKATLRLALLHGHVFVSAVLVPIACAGALVLGRGIGGAAVGPVPLAFLLRGYLGSTLLMLALMLVKSYQLLLAVRAGGRDLAAIDARFFFGREVVRHVVYGAVHVGMAVGLGVFAVALFRSLKRLRTD